MDIVTEPLAPTAPDARIDTLDVLRGVAICGILLMNIPDMGLIGDGAGPAYPARWNADWITWGIQTLVFEGTMRGLFTMLFGAGMLLMLRKTEREGAVTPIDVWTRRCLALMALGCVQWAVFLWPGEILWCYGVTGLGLLAFRSARPKTLLTTALAALIAMAAMMSFGNYQWYEKVAPAKAALVAKAAGHKLTDDQQTAIKAYEDARKYSHPALDDLAKEKAQRTGWGVWGWSWNFWSNFNLGSQGWRDVLESICFMLVGMALFRSGILTGEAPRSTYARLMIVGYGAGFALRAVRLILGSRSGYDLDLDQLHLWSTIFRGITYQPARLLITLGHVGLITTLFRSGALGRATPLKALGRMALTVYSLQSIVTSVLFYGLGYVGVFGFAQLMGIAALIWVATALFCLWWLRSHAMGPAEAALRGIAYGSFRRPWRKLEADRVLATAPPL